MIHLSVFRERALNTTYTNEFSRPFSYHSVTGVSRKCLLVMIRDIFTDNTLRGNDNCYGLRLASVCCYVRYHMVRGHTATIT